MYRKEESTPIPAESFALPFEGKLSSDNRWVMMADLIPWKEFESEYSAFFSSEMGAPAKSFRMALGALIIKERQQLWLYENNKQSIDNRIVSLSEPHIRPIVRGKAGKTVEFGAKLSASCVDGYVFLDHISWDNFNESGDFKTQVETFKQYTGYYPESVHVDKIYRTRDIIQNPFMWIKFIAQEKTELGAKNEELESVEFL